MMAPGVAHVVTDRVDVSLVVCAMNEEGNIGPVLAKVPPVVDEIVVVDGRSTDATVVEALGADPRVRIVTQQGRGKGNALREGVFAARGAIVVQMDADGSMDPAEITRYVDALRWGADLVKGSRMLPGGGSEDLTAFRRFGNWVFCRTANVLHRARFTDICYGFMAYRRDVALGLGLTRDGFDIEAELSIKAHRAGFVVIEVPTFERDRNFGHSNLHAFRDGWKILLTVLRPPGAADATTVRRALPAPSRGLLQLPRAREPRRT